MTRRFWLVLSCMLGLALACPATWASAAPRHSTTVAAVPHGLTPAPPCPAEDACTTLPAQCPSGQACPVVEAGPVTNLGPDQWVYLHAYGFAAGTFLHLNYCADKPGSPTYCATSGTATLVNALYVVQAFADGTTSLSYQVEEVQQGDSPIVGAVPGASPPQTGTFVCDATDPCAIDVTDTGTDNSLSPLPTAANTVVIPVGFEPATNGCPTATTVGTESEFGLDVLLPEASRLSCASADPVLAFNTAIDGSTAVTSLQGGGVDVAFTDDPEQASQQAELKQGNFALIPIALSATVIGYKAQQLGNQVLYPDDSVSLTPNMVAGLITSYYSNPISDPTGKTLLNDSVSCAAQGCRVPPCIQSAKKNTPTSFCSLVAELNYSAGFAMPQTFGGFVRSDNAGSTGLVFSWLCNAPNATVGTPQGQTFTETQTPAQVLEYGLGTQVGTKIKPLSTCPDTDQFPPSSSAVHYTSANDPSQQALKMNSYVGPGLGGTNANAGFGPINWADARYYGLSVAALQNASGHFVAPTEASLDAAINDAVKNPDGTFTADAATSDMAAYPLPSVIYAAVCADPVPGAQATQEKGLLSQLLDLTGGTDSGDLPDGFVPLPASLVQQAQNDVTTDIVGGGAENAGCPPGGGTTAPPTASGSGAGPGSPGQAGSHGPTVTGVGSGAGGAQAVISHPVPATGPTSDLPVGSPSIGSPGGAGGGGHRRSTFAGLTLSSGVDQAIVPVFLGLGMLALVAGGLLLLFGGLRKSVVDFATQVSASAKRVASRTSKSVSGFFGQNPDPSTLSGPGRRGSSTRPWR